MRKFIYGNMVGVTCLSLLTGYLHEPRVITLQEKIDTLALALDGDILVEPYRVAKYVPIPQRKPEIGYTLAYREDFNAFLKGFINVKN